MQRRVIRFLPTWLPLLLLCLPSTSNAQKDNTAVIFGQTYGVHNAACTQTAVASTGTNRATVSTAGRYEVYGYTSSTDFTGVAIKCLQGGSSVTVNAVEGTKIPAGAHVYWNFVGGALSVSCQTGSGAGFYDVCPLN